jgi:hypothetical protein
MSNEGPCRRRIFGGTPTKQLFVSCSQDKEDEMAQTTRMAWWLVKTSVFGVVCFVFDAELPPRVVLVGAGLVRQKREGLVLVRSFARGEAQSTKQPNIQASIKTAILPKAAFTNLADRYEARTGTNRRMEYETTVDVESLAAAQCLMGRRARFGQQCLIFW